MTPNCIKFHDGRNSGRNGPVPKPFNLPPGLYLFNGDDEHRTDSTYVWSSVDHVSTSPPTFHMMYFRSQVDMMNFSSDINDIRRVIATINVQIENGNFSEEDKKQKFRISWLPMIETLINQWGIRRVPSDIAWAVNDVQQSIDVAITIFPPTRPYFSS